MNNQTHQFTFRIDVTTLAKLRYIAEVNCRTLNKELELLVNKYIATYEDTHGVIRLHDVTGSEDQES